MIAARNSVTDSIVDTSTSTSSSAAMRAATTVSMEHAVPELRTTPEVCDQICFLFTSIFIDLII